MPFTPFHFGPGLLLKAALPNHFSLSVFALANVAMDVEPLLHMLRGDAVLHGVTHTLPGAAVIGIATALLGRKLIPPLWNWVGRVRQVATNSVRITAVQAWLGALSGTFSHCLLDAVMHADMSPFAPFSAANPWLKISWTEHVYLFCVVAGMLGLLLMLLRAAFLAEFGSTDKSGSPS